MTRHERQLDEGNVGLNLINVVYGVVLAQVFAPTVHDYRRISGAGWSQLALAATAIILSWVGYYNNRTEYPVWKVTFFNLPFLQYLISVAVLAAYWGLIVTTEGLSTGDGTSASRPLATSARPEAVLVAAIFALYLLWDCLEWRVERTYLHRGRQVPEVLIRRGVARLVVTAIATVVSIVGLGMVLELIPGRSTTLSVVLIDLAYILALFFYRWVQGVAASQTGEPPVGDPFESAGTSTTYIW